MAGLPAAMQAKKVQLEAVHLEPIAVVPPKRPVPVIVNTVPKKEEKKADEAPVIDESEFAVGNEDNDDTTSSTEILEVKPEVKVEKPEGEEEPNYKWMYSSLEGNHKIILQENRDLRDKIVELETKLNIAIAEKQIAAPKVEVVNDLTPEELEQYGDALPVLNKLLSQQQRRLEESVVKPLQAEITELKKSNTDIASRTAASDEGSFVQQVKMQVKDFDAILKSPKWMDFTNRPISPFTDETIGQALLKAHTKRDLTKVVKVFEDFNKSTGNSAADAYRGPTVSSASGTLPGENKKPMLKWSKREEASLKFRKRQIPLEEFNRISEMYRVAEAEGRIDYDK